METAAESILGLFKSEKFCDVTFKIKHGTIWFTFPAHKIVLSIWSPVWADKFQKNKNAFDEEIEIGDIRPSIFLTFFNYLYGSTAELEQNKKDVEFIIDLYKVASRYQVQKLKTYCCEILISSSPNQDNVFNLIDAAILINSDSLEERCHKLLQSETDSIINSLDIEDVTPSIVLTLLKLPSLWLTSEYELLTWVFSWAKSHCKKLKSSKSPKEVISPFLKYLNFTKLKSEEFAILIHNHEEFFDEVECFKIFMNIHIPGSTELPLNYDLIMRKYKKSIIIAPINTLIGDFAAELGYSVNNLTSNECGNVTDNIRPTDVQIYTSDQVSTPSVSLGVDDKVSLNHTLSSSLPSVDNMTDVAMKTNNKKDTSTDNSSVTLDIDTTTTLNDTSLEPTADNMTDLAVDTNDNDSSVSLNIKTSNNISSPTEEINRGQVNAAVLEVVLDQEFGKSWEALEPPIHTEKIRKKKVTKLFLLPEQKSLPNIGIWDPELEPSFLSGDFESLKGFIKKQQNIPIAVGVKGFSSYN